MREAVLHLSGYNYRTVYGMNYRVKEKSPWPISPSACRRGQNRSRRPEAQLSRNGIDVIHGVAHFITPETLRVEGPETDMTLDAGRVIIAVGTKPATSDQVPLNGRTIINSDQIPGYAEAAAHSDRGRRRRHRRRICLHVRHLGVRVTLIEKRNRLLEFADQEIVETLSYHLRDSRVTMRLGEELASVEELEDGTVVANMQSNKRISGDALLYAWEPRAAWTNSSWKMPGLKADSRGRIPVDENFQTANPSIFAVGDVIGFRRWRRFRWSRAELQWRARSMTCTPSPTQVFIPTVFTPFPRSASSARPKNSSPRRMCLTRSAWPTTGRTARGQIRGDTTGRLKLIFHRDTRKVLGVHIIGEGASELVHIGQAVMTLGGNVDYFIETVFNYPTLAECYKVAAFNGVGRLHRYQ